MFTDKELINMPKLTIGIPVSHNTAACLTHLLINQLSDIKISLEDLREEGATLILSCHTRAYPEWMEDDVTENTNQLKQFWEDYMEEQNVRYGINKPFTLDQIMKHNVLAEEGTIKYADPKYWSEEKKAYCQRIEDEIFAEGLFDSVTEEWEEEEDYDD